MIVKRPAAARSIVEQASWISEDSPEAAMRFLEAVEQTFLLLEKNPEMGRPYPAISRRLAGVRVWRIPGFEKHLVFYRPSPDGVEILDVVHGARDIPSVLVDLF